MAFNSKLNYTDWLKTEYPQLKNSSSAETFQYIEQAKADTKTITILLVFFMPFALLYPMNHLLTSYGFAPFESIFYWCMFLAVTFIGSLLMSKLESEIIKRKLRHLLKNSQP
ncbi:hypothetical protein JK628_01095 [Shewanella sp. KX20019]|uniref:hypothetical protein n=1 Tax=Shewanella sp. KX20019 TaxID=2803864 RepID=UPI001927534C|nr:hypothetical protein [Shewanella sp. KX20019]QQX80508.1 hypothetical protein JK628_01095 [Shewanella sp. KX20019]